MPGTAQPLFAEREASLSPELATEQNTMKRLVAFDLDGTLAESKQPIDPEMAGLLARLSSCAIVAVISGGDWPQFRRQLVGNLPDEMDLARWFLLPTSGGQALSP